MRIRITLSPKTGELLLPKDHRHLLGATLHLLLHGEIPHERTIGLHGFSPLFWKERRLEADKLRFLGDGALVFSSAHAESLEAFFQPRALEMGGNLVDVKRAELVEEPAFMGVMRWTAHRQAGLLTQEEVEGRKRFVSPHRDKAKAQIVLENSLRAKWQAFCRVEPKRAARWTGEDDPVAWANGQSIRVTIDSVTSILTHRVHLSEIHAWGGALTIEAPPPLQRLIWAAGLGAKTQMGLGFLEPVSD